MRARHLLVVRRTARLRSCTPWCRSAHSIGLLLTPRNTGRTERGINKVHLRDARLRANTRFQVMRANVEVKRVRGSTGDTTHSYRLPMRADVTARVVDRQSDGDQTGSVLGYANVIGAGSLSSSRIQIAARLDTVHRLGL